MKDENDKFLATIGKLTDLDVLRQIQALCLGEKACKISLFSEEGRLDYRINFAVENFHDDDRAFLALSLKIKSFLDYSDNVFVTQKSIIRKDRNVIFMDLSSRDPSILQKEIQKMYRVPKKTPEEKQISDLVALLSGKTALEREQILRKVCAEFNLQLVPALSDPVHRFKNS